MIFRFFFLLKRDLMVLLPRPTNWSVDLYAARMITEHNDGSFSEKRRKNSVLN